MRRVCTGRCRRRPFTGARRAIVGCFDDLGRYLPQPADGRGSDAVKAGKRETGYGVAASIKALSELSSFSGCFR